MVRPSVVFGQEDELFNRFAGLARFSPVLPVIGGDTKFQPVFAGDVAEAIASLVDNGSAHAGKTFRAWRTDVMTLRDIMEFTLETTGRRRLLVPGAVCAR